MLLQYSCEPIPTNINFLDTEKKHCEVFSAIIIGKYDNYVDVKKDKLRLMKDYEVEILHFQEEEEPYLLVFLRFKEKKAIDYINKFSDLGFQKVKFQKQSFTPTFYYSDAYEVYSTNKSYEKIKH